MKKKILALLLAAALGLSSITVLATATDANTNDMATIIDDTSANDSIILNKEVTQTPNDNGEYTLTLESYTTGIVTTTETNVPTDIILVLDQSYSMNYDFAGANYNKRYDDSRQKAMLQSVADFIINVGKTAKSNNIDHKIAIVMFGTNSYVLSDYSENYGTTYTWEDGKSSSVSGSFTNKGESGSLVEKVLDLGIADLAHTHSQRGMEDAYDLLEENINSITEGEKRNQVVIMFTDGQPTITNPNSFSTSIANGAIQAASEMSDLGATVYTVGIFEGADPNGTSNPNKYMNYTSSNYPDATSMTNYGEKKAADYYLTASDAEGLSDIFENIYYQVSTPSVSLSDRIEIRDVVSQYFEMNDGFSTKDVTVEIVPCTGYNSTTGEYMWGTGTDVSNDSAYTIGYDKENKQVSLSGFDYDANFVTQTPKTDGGSDYGSKVVIKFNIKPIEGFIGGIDVPTNTVGSGIYVKNEEDDTFSSLESFPVPDVDVPLNLDIVVKDQSIYLGNTMSYKNLLSIDDHAIQGITNAYVDIEFTVYEDKNGDGVVSTSEDPIITISIPHGEFAQKYEGDNQIMPTDCTKYLVKYTVTPVDPYTNQETGEGKLTETEQFTVHVLKPTISTNDIYVDYGTSVNLRSDCAGSNFAYEINADGTLGDVITDDNGQPVDKNGYQTDRLGYYLVYKGTTNKVPATETDLSNTESSNERPSGVIWETSTEHEIENPDNTDPIPLANAQYPPRVVFGFTARRGIEYTTQEFYDLGVRENKEFYISSITTYSTDGKNIITRYENPKLADSDLDFKIYINRYDLEITKTISKDDWEDYEQDIVFRATYLGTEFTTVEKTPDGATDGETVTKVEVSGLGDIEKVVKVIMPIYDFTLVGNDYVCTKTVKNLYAGLEVKVTEEDDWSWRFETNMDPVDGLKCDSSVPTSTKLSIDTVAQSANIFISNGESYLTIKNGSNWDDITNWTELERNDLAVLPSTDPNDGINPLVTLSIENNLEIDGDEWISFSELITNIFNPKTFTGGN